MGTSAHRRRKLLSDCTCAVVLSGTTTTSSSTGTGSLRHRHRVMFWWGKDPWDHLCATGSRKGFIGFSPFWTLSDQSPSPLQETTGASGKWRLRNTKCDRPMSINVGSDSRSMKTNPTRVTPPLVLWAQNPYGAPNTVLHNILMYVINVTVV